MAKFILILFTIISMRLSAQHEMGLVSNLNFSFVHQQDDHLTGKGGGNLGFYIERPLIKNSDSLVHQRYSYLFEPVLNATNFRNTSSDVKYGNYYFDASVYLNYYPVKQNNDLRLMMGLRPSILMTHNSKLLVDGRYNLYADNPLDKNKNGDLDFALLVGIGTALGNGFRVELKYAQSFTNRINDQGVRGRPSTLEIGLRLNVPQVQKKQEIRTQAIQTEVQHQAEGTLLVMLQTLKEDYLAQLKRKGFEDIEGLKMNQLKTNEMVIKAFKDHFNFCQVRFFMDSSSDEVARHHFDRILVDEEMKPSLIQDIDKNNYLIASFCQDVNIFSQRLYFGLYVYDDKFQQKGELYNNIANGISKHSYSDYDQNYHKPVPMFYRQDDFNRVVLLLNDRLFRQKVLIQKD